MARNSKGISADVYKQIYNFQNNKFLQTNVQIQTNHQFLKTNESDNDTQFFNNTMQISEQLRLAKQKQKQESQKKLQYPEIITKYSFNDMKLKKMKKKEFSCCNLNDFVQESLIKKLARDKFAIDQQKEKTLSRMTNNDQGKLIKSQSELSKQEPSKLRTPRSKFISFSSSRGQFFPTDFKTEQSLNQKITNLQDEEIKQWFNEVRDSQNPRQATQKIQEWFEKNQISIDANSSKEDKQKALHLIQVVYKEIVEQTKIECHEKGILLEEIWDYLNNFMKNVLEQFNLSIQREQVNSIEEFNRVHLFYQQKQSHFEQEVEKLRQQVKKKCILSLKQNLIELTAHENTQQNLAKIDFQYKRLRNQFEEYKKIVIFLKRKVEDLKKENAYLQKLNQIKKNTVGIQKSERVIEESQKNEKSSDGEEEQYLEEPPNVLSALLDEKNVIEITNMVLNMDKIVNVANFAQQIESDFVWMTTSTCQIQTDISMMGQDFNILCQNQQKLEQVIEQLKLKKQVEESLERIQKVGLNSKSLNLHIEHKFFKHSLDAKQPIISQLDNSQQNTPDQMKDGIGELNIDNEGRTQYVIHQIFQSEVERVKVLIELLQTSEYNLKEAKKQIEINMIEAQRIQQNQQNMNNKLIEEIKQLQEELAHFKKSQELAKEKDHENEEQQQINQTVRERKKGRLSKQYNQAKLMIFKGPQLGQKVTINFDFLNVGKEIVERVKTKQVQKIKTFMPLKLLLKQITLLYFDKLQSQAENPAIKELDLSSFSYQYFFKQFGIKKIADQKFLILVLSLKHHRQVVRVNVFGKFLGLYDVNYSIDELKKYLEALDFFVNISQLGQKISDNESEVRYFIPFIRAQQYLGQFTDSRMTIEEREQLKNEVEMLKEIDPKTKQGIIDFDQFMINLFVKYKILVSRAKEYVINAFAACDLDGNGMCNFEEWHLLIRHIEPDRLTPEQISEIFFANADLIVEGEQNFSFEKFAVVCVEYGLFTDEAQNQMINSKGTRTELLSQFQKMSELWILERKKIEERFDQITILPSEKIDHWREIIETLDKKINEMKGNLSKPGIEKRLKPLLIAFQLLNKESSMLLEFQENQNEDNEEDEQDEQDQFQ